MSLGAFGEVKGARMERGLRLVTWCFVHLSFVFVARLSGDSVGHADDPSREQGLNATRGWHAPIAECIIYAPLSP
jgi:hypothetical protein